MFEPVIKTDLSLLPKTIETNLDELAPIIDEKVAVANALVINVDSEEDLVRCDADAALLNKMSKRINRFRLDWTAQWQAPFNGVIAKCKDYEKRLADAAGVLRGKSEVGKVKIKDAKRTRLEEMWGRVRAEHGEAIEGAAHFATFFATMTDDATKGNWLLKGAKDAAIEDAMTAELARCKQAADMVKVSYAQDEEAQAVALRALEAHFDITEAMQAANNHIENRKRIEAARKAREEQEAAQADTIIITSGKMVECPIKTHDEPAEAVMPAPRVLVTESAPIETYRLAVTGTRAALVALRKWGEANGISFKNLDK